MWEAGGKSWPLEQYLKANGDPKAMYGAPLKRVKSKLMGLVASLREGMTTAPAAW